MHVISEGAPATTTPHQSTQKQSDGRTPITSRDNRNTNAPIAVAENSTEDAIQAAKEGEELQGEQTKDEESIVWADDNGLSVSFFYLPSLTHSY